MGGQNIADNALFKTEASSLALILYQDALEVANPLDSGKNKHKVLAFYFTLGKMLYKTAVQNPPDKCMSVDFAPKRNRQIYMCISHFC